MQEPAFGGVWRDELASSIHLRLLRAAPCSRPPGGQADLESPTLSVSRAEVWSLAPGAASAIRRHFKGRSGAVLEWLNGLPALRLRALAGQAALADGRGPELPEAVGGGGGLFLAAEHLELISEPGTLGWVALRSGKLAPSGAPKPSVVEQWVREGATCVVSLLREDEPHFAAARDACRAARLRWEHCPLSGKRAVTAPSTDEDVRSLGLLLRVLPELAEAGERVVVHCAAGMHRTGGAIFSAIRCSGFSAEEALGAIAAARPVTHAALCEAEKRFQGRPLWEVIEQAVLGREVHA